MEGDVECRRRNVEQVAAWHPGLHDGFQVARVISEFTDFRPVFTLSEPILPRVSGIGSADRAATRPADPAEISQALPRR
jgi:hypothetical protein